jgi:hypothetical protein
LSQHRAFRRPSRNDHQIFASRASGTAYRVACASDNEEPSFRDDKQEFLPFEAHASSKDLEAGCDQTTAHNATAQQQGFGSVRIVDLVTEADDDQMDVCRYNASLHVQPNAYQQHQAQVAQERRDREQAEYDSIVAHITAASNEYDTAHNDYVAARQAGDLTMEANAQGRMARFQARLENLENGKGAMEQRAVQAQQQQAQYTPEQRADHWINNNAALMSEEREWMKRHKHLLMDQNSAKELEGTFLAASQRLKLARGSDEFFRYMEDRLGLSDGGRGEEEEMPENKPAPTTRRVGVQAPPSRAGVDLNNGRQREEGSTKITLTKQQRQAAQWSGVDEHTYAKELKRLQDYKKQGYYSES